MNVRILSTLVIVMIVLSAPQGAPSAASSDTSAAATAVFGGLREYTLDNGLAVFILPHGEMPIVSLQIWYAAGSRDEAPGESGIAHFLEHMYSMGTATLGPREMDTRVRRVGGQKNASTSVDYTRYYEDIPASALGEFLALEAERMRGCTFPDDKVMSERDTVAEERRTRNEDDPGGAAYQALYELMYEGHPYSHPTVGYMDDIAKYDRNELLSYYDGHYYPADATLVIAGAVDPDAAFAQVKKAFGDLPNPDVRIPPPQSFATSQTSERRLTMFHPSPLPLLYIAWPTVTFGDGQGFALDVLGEVLAGGRSSRLYKRLVRKDKLATSVVGGHSERRLGGAITLRINYSAPETEPDVEAAVFDEIARLAADGVTGDELARAKKRILASEVFGAQSNNGLAAQIGWAAAMGDWRYVLAYPAGIERVTAAEVKDACAKFLGDKTRNVVILLPAKSTPKSGGGQQ